MMAPTRSQSSRGVVPPLKPLKKLATSQSERILNTGAVLPTFGELDEVGKCVNTLRGHKDRVWAVCVGGEGMLYTASEDASIRQWSISTGACLQAFRGHTSYVHVLVWDPRAARLYSGAGDRIIRQWCPQRSRSMHKFKGHNYAVLTLALSDDGAVLLSGSHDSTVRAWSIATRECIRVLEGHTAAVWSIIVAGGRIFSGARDCTIREWDLSSGRCTRILNGHQDIVSALVLGPDRSTLYSSSADGTIRMWCTSKGDLLKVLVGHSDWVRGLAVSSDGAYLYSGACDATVKVWKVSTGDCVRTLTGHQGDINSVALTAGDHFLVTASKDTTAKIWRVKPGTVGDGEGFPPLERQKSVPLLAASMQSEEAVVERQGGGEETKKNIRRSASVGKLSAALSAPRPGRSGNFEGTPGGSVVSPHTPWKPVTADEVIDSWAATGQSNYNPFDSGLDMEAVVCPICKEDFTFEGATQPLLLPCGHTYCQTCLSQQKPLVCALCRAPAGCGMGDLKKNYTLVDLIRSLTVGEGDDGPDVVDGHLPPAAVRAATPSPEKGGAGGLGGAVEVQDRLDRRDKRRKSFESGSPCEECSEAPAALVCRDCDMAYCAACCGATHRATKAMSKHAAPVPIEEWRAQAPLCPQHGMPVSAFCGLHGVTMCPDCGPAHARCMPLSIEDAAGTYRSSLSSYLEQLQGLRGRIDHGHRDTEDKRAALAAELATAEGELNDRFDRLVAELACQRAHAITSLQRAYLARAKRPTAILRELEERGDEMDGLSAETSRALGLGDVELLRVAEPLRTRLRSHTGSSEVTMPETPRLESVSLDFQDGTLKEAVAAWGMPAARAECTLCLRGGSGGNSKLLACRHLICATCLRSHLSSQLMYRELPLRCPLPACGEAVCAR
mmetsp:Transcript_648/g.2164  ORF Transcript_648/g.2164 Transcript_648/m.2164 type:complete len:896 (+) Transcript_648:124-2811(+)